MRIPPPITRGASANRHERWGRDAMDVLAARDERGRCGRRNRVVLIPRRWDQAGGSGDVVPDGTDTPESVGDGG